MRLPHYLLAMATGILATATGFLAEAKEASPKADATLLPERKVSISTLPNGLTLLIEEDHSAPVASVQVWCGTGSIHEGAQMGAGLSHILEHMLFKGTTTRKGGEIARDVQNQGGYINAYTSFDRTVYWIDVPATGVSQAVDILSDAMMNSTLPEEEYTKEQEVIRREFAMGFDDPGRMSSQLMLRTTFSESPFRHPVIGYLDVYNKLTREDVMKYYKERYTPNNLTFVIVGDVDAAKIRAQLEAYFAKYPRQRLEPVYVPTEPEQVGRRDSHEEFPTELSRPYLAWRIPGLTNPDTPALDLLAAVLGDGRSSLLNREIREKKGLAHTISAGMLSLQTEGIFVINAVADPGKTAEIERDSLAIVEQIKKNGVAQADFDRARKVMLSDQLSQLSTARGRASDLGSSWLLTKNVNFSKDYLDAINRVTLPDLQRVAREYLRPDRLNATSLDPVGATPAAAEKNAAIVAPEIKKFTLPNGLRLLVREDPRLPLVSITAVFRGGVLAETKEINGISRLLSRAMLKGTKTRTAEQIATQIESAGGSISSDSGNNSFNISLEVMKPDLKLGMEILADVLQNPSFPEREVELEKASQLAGIKAEEEQITTVARNLVRDRLYGSHPYALRSNGAADTVAGLSAVELKKFHEALVVAKNGVIAVFGDVKAEDVLKMTEKYFSVLPAGELAMENAPSPELLSGSVLAMQEIPKQQAVLMIGYPGTNVLDPDQPVLELISEASSDLGSRFFNRIREKMGLAYFVGASQFSGLAPGCFIFYLGTDPAKLSKVKLELEDEVGLLATNGLTQEELDRAKKKLLGSEAIRNQSNSAFAAVTAVNELVGLGYDASSRRAAQIMNVTLDDVRRVCAKYFKDKPRVEAIIRPPEPTTASSTPADKKTP